MRLSLFAAAIAVVLTAAPAFAGDIAGEVQPVGLEDHAL